MRFKTINQINGESNRYELSSEIKPYTLRDTGFSKSNAGDYVLKHALGLNGPQLKIVVQDNLREFKMDITDNQGLRKINIFDGKHSSAVNQFKYLIQNLILRKVLIRK